jgi:hypothetical protein
MPTEVHARLLDREVSKAAVAPAIANATALLREIVNYGTQLFARANASATKGVRSIARQGRESAARSSG